MGGVMEKRERRARFWCPHPTLSLPGLHRLPDHIAFQSRTPDRRNRQSPHGRTGTRLFHPQPSPPASDAHLPRLAAADAFG